MKINLNNTYTRLKLTRKNKPLSSWKKQPIYLQHLNNLPHNENSSETTHHISMAYYKY